MHFNERRLSEGCRAEPAICLKGVVHALHLWSRPFPENGTFPGCKPHSPENLQLLMHLLSAGENHTDDQHPPAFLPGWGYPQGT